MSDLGIHSRAVPEGGVSREANPSTDRLKDLNNIAPARQSDDVVRQLHSEPELTTQQKAQAVFRAVGGDIVTEIFGEDNFQDPNVSRMFGAARGENVSDPAVITIVNKLYEDWAGPNAKYGL
jgi:hypothetical protein